MRISDWSSDVFSSDLKKDNYYQPWLRDPAPTPVMGAPMQGEGLAKPKEEPPVGIDLTRYSKPEKPRGEPLVKPEAIKAGAAHLWDRVRGGADAFADWTIRAGERADIPARVELGRGSCRARGWQYATRTVVGGSLKRKKYQNRSQPEKQPSTQN